MSVAGQDGAEKTTSTRHTGCIQWLQVPLYALLKSLESIPAKYLDLSILFMCFFYSFQKSRIEKLFTETYSLSQRVVAYSMKKGSAAQSATPRG